MKSYLLAMFIWGTIGLFVRGIDLPSAAISCSRGFLGGAVLLAVTLALQSGSLRRLPLKLHLRYALAGIGIGLNWMFLFEAYRHTTIAMATLCYYMAPALITLFSPFVLGETLSRHKLLCLAGCFIGFFLMVTSQETASAGKELSSGVLYGLAGAFTYACVVLHNKTIPTPNALAMSTLQILWAGVAMLPYVILTTDVSSFTFSTKGLVLLLIVGIVHTGLAFYLWFGAMPKLSAQRISIFSYVDPLVAVAISVFFLGEALSFGGWFGALLLLGSTLAADLRR